MKFHPSEMVTKEIEIELRNHHERLSRPGIQSTPSLKAAICRRVRGLESELHKRQIGAAR